MASSSTDGSTKFWDLGTGQETEKTAEVSEVSSDTSAAALTIRARQEAVGFTFPKEGGARERRINSYVVAAKGQTLVIHKAPEDKAEDKAETAADGKAGTETPVAFFQCASQIEAFDVAGANVAVGCADGQVLQLFAAVLQTQA